MTDKIPVRGVFSGTTATGLAEFQTGEKIAGWGFEPPFLPLGALRFLWTVVNDEMS